MDLLIPFLLLPPMIEFTPGDLIQFFSLLKWCQDVHGIYQNVPKAAPTRFYFFLFLTREKERREMHTSVH